MFLWSSLCVTVLLKDNLIHPIPCFLWYKSTNKKYYQIVVWNIEATGFSLPSSVSHMSYLAWVVAWKRIHLFYSTIYFFHIPIKPPLLLGPYNIFTILGLYFTLTYLKDKSDIFLLCSFHGFDQVLISQTLVYFILLYPHLLQHNFF